MRGSACHWINAVPLQGCRITEHRFASCPPSYFCWSCGAFNRGSHKHTAQSQNDRRGKSLEVEPAVCVCVFPSEPSMFWLFVCQNKALSGFTHGVYCECARRIVRSGHARGRPMCLCWVKKWKLPVRELAGWQTRVRREVSDFPLTLSLLLCRGP